MSNFANSLPTSKELKRAFIAFIVSLSVVVISLIGIAYLQGLKHGMKIEAGKCQEHIELLKTED